MEPTNSHTDDSYDYRRHRSRELRRANRRVGLIALLVAVLLVVFTVIYVVFFGGSNIDPRPPLHSLLAPSVPGAVPGAAA